MAAKSTKKQMKIKQRDYMMLINTPKEVGKWVAEQNITRNHEDSKVLEAEKRGNQVSNKHSKDSKHQHEDVERIFVEKESKLKAASPVNGETKGKEKATKVKQIDLLRDLEQEQKRAAKSSKKKRDVFTDGWEISNLEGPRRRIVTFSEDSRIQHRTSPEERLNHSSQGTSNMDLKRYHSPMEVSRILDNIHAPRTTRKRRTRKELKERPVDLSTLIYNKLTSGKQNSEETNATMFVKHKVPFLNGNSKKYDLSKEHQRMGNHDGSQSKMFKVKHLKDKEFDSEKDEIYISLNPKSPQEKRRIFEKQKQELINEFVDNDEISDRNLSVDGTWSKNEQERLTYSDLDHKDEMLF